MWPSSRVRLRTSVLAAFREAQELLEEREGRRRSLKKSAGRVPAAANIVVTVN